MSSLPAPRYSLWQAVSAALAVALRAIEEVRALARQPGPQGERGERGERGLGVDDMDIGYDGRRTFTFKWSKGEHVETRSFRMPLTIDAGVWKEGDYQAGDQVSFRGHLWVALKDTSAQPDTAPTDWRMQIRKPRDGRDGKTGDRGIAGPKGDKGDPGPRNY